MKPTDRMKMFLLQFVKVRATLIVKIPNPSSDTLLERTTLNRKILKGSCTAPGKNGGLSQLNS